MDEVLLRFPHLGEKTFKQLTNKNLVKSMIVSKAWNRFITNGKFYKLRVQYENVQKIVDADGNTPLHTAAKYGDLSGCKLILDNVENKNPANSYENTPLHQAAGNGHLDICRLIIENVNNKHPFDNFGDTPKDLAVGYNHADVSHLFE